MDPRQRRASPRDRAAREEAAAARARARARRRAGREPDAGREPGGGRGPDGGRPSGPRGRPAAGGARPRGSRGHGSGSSARRPPLLGVVAGLLVLALVAVLVLGPRLGGGSPGTARDAPSGGGDPVARTAAATAARLSPDRLAGQRVVVAFREGGATVPEALRAAVADGRVAGVVLFAENGDTRAELRPLVRRLQAIRRPAGLRDPLLVMVDQEGGVVRRVTDAPPDRTPAELGEAGPDAARAEGRRTGRALRGAGVTVDLAPVADVGRPGRALQREGRTYGTDPARVASVARAFAAGLRDGGVAAAAKHAPGIGALARNTDDVAGRIDLSAATLRERDAVPFRALVADRVPLMMLSSAVYPALDPSRPAVLSPTVVRDEVRGRLGFAGVTMSDDLQAGALRQTAEADRVALAAAGADVDILLYASSLEGGLAAQRTLSAAIAAGRLPRAAAEASAARVLALRARLARPAGSR